MTAGEMWLRNSLKAAASDQREAERHCRKHYAGRLVEPEAERLANVYAEAAKVFEDALARLDAARGGR